MVHSGDAYHPARYGPWQLDWRQAWELCEPLIIDARARTGFLEGVIIELRGRMADDTVWAAIAALADELMAHEQLEAEAIAETLDFWLARHTR
jgi:hypothetical protein